MSSKTTYYRYTNKKKETLFFNGQLVVVFLILFIIRTFLQPIKLYHDLLTCDIYSHIFLLVYAIVFLSIRACTITYIWVSYGRINYDYDYEKPSKNAKT
jgi:hypothetical protein